MEDLIAENFEEPIELELAMFFFLAPKLLIEKVAKKVRACCEREGQLLGATDPFRRSREEAAQ